MAHSVNPDESARYDPSHLVLRCLQRYMIWFAWLKNKTSVSGADLDGVSRGSVEPGLEFKIFHFHNQTSLAHLNPLSENPGSHPHYVFVIF